MNYHLLSLSELSRSLNTNPNGLDSVAVNKLLLEYGSNLLTETKTKSVWRMIFNQFTDLMILILIAAAIISAFLGDLTDSLVIFTIVLINAIVGLSLIHI